MKKENKTPTITAAVLEYFDALPDDQEFSGIELWRAIGSKYKDYRFTYPDTMLRRLRQYRRWLFVAINPNRSIYKKIKPVFGKGISNAIDLRKNLKRLAAPYSGA